MKIEIPLIFDNESHTCLEDLGASIVNWYGRPFQLMYAESWGFAFDTATITSRKLLGERLNPNIGNQWSLLERHQGIRLDKREHELAFDRYVCDQVTDGTPVIFKLASKLNEKCSWGIAIGFDRKRGSIHYLTQNRESSFRRSTKAGSIRLDEFANRTVYTLTPTVLSSDEILNVNFQQLVIAGVMRSMCGGIEPTSYQSKLKFADAIERSLDIEAELRGYSELFWPPLLYNLMRVSHGRSQFSRFLDFTHELFPLPGLRDGSSEIKRLGREWWLIRSLLIKLAMAPKDSKLVSHIANRIRSLASEEANVAKRLQQIDWICLGKLESSKANLQIASVVARSKNEPPYPNPSHPRPRLAFSPALPLNGTEFRLCGIWAEVLGVDVIGTMDDFFELGGDSLSAVRVLGRVCEEFGVKLSLRRLFESPTVSGLAILIDAEGGLQGKVGNSSMIPRANRSEDALPLSFAQQRLWFFDQLEPGNVFYNIPSAVRLRGPLCMTALWWSVNEIIRRHESLRTTFARREGQPIQVVADELQLPLRVIDLRGLPDAEQRAQQLARREAERAFSLECGPLLRIVLLWIGDEDYLLVRITHHIISDGWSESIFLKELAVFYNGRVSGRHTTLPALPIQYVDFSVWQRQQLQGEMLAKQQAYWNEQLRDSPPILKLPIDRPRPEIQSFRGGVCSLKLPKEQTEELKKLSRQEGTTLFMTLLTALKVLLYRLSGQSDICVGTPISNRTRPETEGIIGLFLNMLPLRTHVQEDMSFRDLLRTVQKTCLDAFANKDIPFEMLVRAVSGRNGLAISPIFQVVFQFQNTPKAHKRIAGIDTSKVRIMAPVAKFDLLLNMCEEDDGELFGLLEYCIDIFKHDSALRLMRQLKRIIDLVAIRPDDTLFDMYRNFQREEDENTARSTKRYEEILRSQLRTLVKQE